MKQNHSGDLHVTVDLPTQDLEDLLDKVKDTACVIIGVAVGADIVRHIVKGWYK